MIRYIHLQSIPLGSNGLSLTVLCRAVKERGRYCVVISYPGIRQIFVVAVVSKP